MRAAKPYKGISFKPMRLQIRKRKVVKRSNHSAIDFQNVSVYNLSQ